MSNRLGPSMTPCFCYISPIATLNHVAQFDTHLVLAHLVLTNEHYRRFYEDLGKRGDTIIMDNSAFELGASFDPNMLMELGESINATCLVLPDYPNHDPSRTIAAAEEWARKFSRKFQTMFVPQSSTGDLNGWLRAYDFAANYRYIDAIGMSILGIPNALPDVPRNMARIIMTQKLIEQNRVAKKYHHYLGLNGSPNVEIPALLAQGLLNSIDSSNPFWTAYCGIGYNPSYEAYAGVSKQFLPPVDFMSRLRDDTHHTGVTPELEMLIKNNISLTEKLFS